MWELATLCSHRLSPLLQSASLCLTTTPAEEVAVGVGMLLSPLRLIGLPVSEISLTLLLSLRFLAIVFEEIRNLALGLAARNIQWRAMGKGAGVTVCLCLLLHRLSVDQRSVSYEHSSATAFGPLQRFADPCRSP